MRTHSALIANTVSLIEFSISQPSPDRARPTLTAKLQCHLMYFERNARRYRQSQTCPAAFTYQYVPTEKTQLALRLRTRVLRARRRKTSRLPRTNYQSRHIAGVQKEIRFKNPYFSAVNIPYPTTILFPRAPPRFHRNIKRTAAPVFFGYEDIPKISIFKIFFIFEFYSKIIYKNSCIFVLNFV